MLLALAVIYPLLLKNFDLTTLVIAPVVSSLLIGYMIKTYGAMPISNGFETFTYSCNIRGIALVLLGCFCYLISEKIKNADFSNLQRIALIICENVCWIISMYFMVSKINPKYESYVIYLMALGITLTFSRSLDSKFYNSKFVYYLGKISLPIYLCQNIARDIVRHELDFLSVPMRIFAIAAIAIVIGVLADLICSKIKISKLINNKKLCK